MDAYSLDKSTDDFEKYSERITNKYVGYGLDKDLKLRANSAKVVSFNKLKEALLGRRRHLE
eukprot:CAMPEP_0116879738 /NCGR_PEP_ID=MMETSP0463-20121206/11558_1 /TAXON_ID=181622 /ORGANISM="Strombidinopsis sp, Strain SopsisLIS2011" /LENGTH=60 /DNA_ID=CAMNT_0004529399 /DNA_START=263 /DNA_END=445 /DNA_ORIENTATION=+